MSAYDSLLTVLGLSEETAQDFTVQTASDIADRSVELCQILERLAKDGDAICQALESRTIAQGDISGGQSSVRLLKTILPHIKMYYAGRVGQGVVQDGEVSSTECPATSNESKASSSSHDFPTSQESSSDNMLSQPSDHVPSTLEQPAVAIHNPLTSCTSTMASQQSCQPALERERKITSQSENDASSSDQVTQSLLFSHSPLVSATLADSSEVLASKTVSKASSVAIEMVPNVSEAVTLLQPSEPASNRPELAPTTPAASTQAPTTIVAHTCLAQPIAAPYAAHMALPPPHASAHMASMNPPSAARGQAVALPQSPPPAPWLSDAQISQYAPSAQSDAALNVRQGFSVRPRWPSAQYVPLPSQPQLAGQHQYYPLGINAVAPNVLQSTTNRFRNPSSANLFNMVAQPPQGGMYLREPPHAATGQAVPPLSSRKRFAPVLPVMPLVMTPTLFPGRKEDRMPLGSLRCTALSSVPEQGKQLAAQNLVYPHQGHPPPRQQHLAAVIQPHHELTQPGRHRALSTMYPSQPHSQSTRSTQDDTVELTPVPQNLMMSNHPFITVRQIPVGSAVQPSSYGHITAVATIPPDTEKVPKSQSVTQPSVNHDQSPAVECVPLCVDPPLELLTEAGGSVKQQEERCSEERDRGKQHAPCSQSGPASTTTLSVEEPSKSQCTTNATPQLPVSFTAPTNGPSRVNAGENELVKIGHMACLSSPEHHPRNPASKRDDGVGVAAPQLQVQGPIASASEVHVLASGSVRSPPCADPMEVPQAVPAHTPICQEPATDSSGCPLADVPVHLTVDTLVEHADEHSTQSKVDSAVQTAPQASHLSVEPTVHCPITRTGQLPVDPTIQPTAHPIVHPPPETTIQSSTDAAIHLPVDAAVCLPKVPTVHAPLDPTDLPTDRTVCPPMRQSTCPLSTNSKGNEGTILNGRLSFVALIKQHALLHLAALASLSKSETGRLATEKEMAAFFNSPMDTTSIEMSEGPESMESGTTGTSVTSQSVTAFKSTASEGNRHQENPSLSSSQCQTPSRPKSSQSAESRVALVGSPQAKGKQAKLKRRHRPPPLIKTSKRKLPREDRVPPLSVGTAVLIKFGIGEKATWREGIITGTGSSGKKHRGFMVASEGKPCYHCKALHQLAVAEPAKGDDLRIKDSVVGWYGDLGIRFSGVVAETPVKENGYRVLVFFVDGFAQYLSPSQLHLSYQWDRIIVDREYSKGMMSFVHRYFSGYPKRLMLRLKEGDSVQLERFQGVLEARVVQVDCSMVKLQFTARESSEEEENYEWLYRGSTRLIPLCMEVERRKPPTICLQINSSVAPCSEYTFTDDLFDPECPPSSTPPDNTGIFPCSGQAPGKEQFTVENVAKLSAVSVLQRRSSELQRHLSAPSPSSPSVDPNVNGLPIPPPILHTGKEALSFGVKRAVSVDGYSKAKRARSLSTDVESTIGNTVSDVEDDDNDSVFQATSRARCAKKSKPAVRSSSVDLPSHRHLQQQSATPAASSAAPPQGSEGDDTFLSKEYVAKHFPPPEFDHRCGPPCKEDVSLPDDYLLYHSLVFPLMLKWRRCKQMYRKGNRQASSSSHLYYVAPCGIRLKTLQEVENQLCAMEEDRLTVDMFSFDVTISVNFKPIERPPTAQFYNEDLSGGLDMVPLPCINELDTEAPPAFEYAAMRRCGPGVDIGSSKDFLVSCTCGSGHCAKEGCLCSKLSMEEAQRTRVHDLMNPLHIAEVGYTHRRLLTERIAAIFECNDGCQCSSSCGNRVIQSKMRPRLQVFKTADRGWGVRCLDDLPKGTFLAHYAGIILTDKDADEAAHLHTDAYLVDLDYVEVMESQKCGIESDPLTGSSNTSSDSATTIPAFSFDSQTTADNLDHTWEGSSPTEEMEEGGSNTHRNGDTNTRRGTRATSSGQPMELPSSNLAPEQSELPCSSRSPDHGVLDLPHSSDLTHSPISDDEGDLPVFDLVNMTSRHPALNITSSAQNSKGPLATVKKESVPSVKQEEHSSSLGGFGEEVLGRRRHVGTGARRATGASREDPICLCESESDEDSGELGTDSSTPSSGSSPSSGASPSSSTALERLPIPVSSPSIDTRVSLQRQFFGEQQVFVIDASRVGNVARFFNHSCQPNLFVQNVFVDNHDIRLPWVALFAKTNIKAMTELTWDYNYVPGSVPNRELECKCGVPECRGRLL